MKLGFVAVLLDVVVDVLQMVINSDITHVCDLARADDGHCILDSVQVIEAVVAVVGLLEKRGDGSVSSRLGIERYA